MKIYFAILFTLVLCACSGSPPRQQTIASGLDKQALPSATAESAFQESTGTLNLVFDAQGNWVRLSAKGTAGLADDSPAARESALMIASLRAKRTLAEFLSSQVKSDSTVRRIAKTYARNFQSAEQSGDELAADSEAAPSADDEKRIAKSEQAHRVASVLVERIQESSAAILKGVHVTYRSFEDGRVIVEVSASKQSIATARLVSRAMSGGL